MGDKSKKSRPARTHLPCLIYKRGCRAFGLSPTKNACLYILLINFSFLKKKKKKNLSMAVKNLFEFCVTSGAIRKHINERGVLNSLVGSVRLEKF
jgi:hypothetical protein